MQDHPLLNRSAQTKPTILQAVKTGGDSLPSLPGQRHRLGKSLRYPNPHFVGILDRFLTRPPNVKMDCASEYDAAVPRWGKPETGVLPKHFVHAPPQQTVSK